MASARIVDILRNQAEEEAKSRRIAEFGPAGGNPNARAEDHIEWKAAEYIELLESKIELLESKVDKIKEISNRQREAIDKALEEIKKANL